MFLVFVTMAFVVVGMDARGPGQWLSTNEKVMHVNQVTGEAHARGEGIAEGMELKPIFA